MDARLRELIASDAPEPVLLKAALENGMRYLLEDGLGKISAGVTSIEELLRVVYIRDEDTKKTCPSCGESISAETKNCPHCGNPPENKCPGCGSLGDGKWQFCPFCGNGYSPNPVPLPIVVPFGQP
jgi:RNA polymerase subunit RPABC4/transcription elongation factor Spt4